MPHKSSETSNEMNIGGALREQQRTDDRLDPSVWRDERLDELFERPHEMLVGLATDMFALYQDRAVTVELPDGTTEMQFATTEDDDKGIRRLEDRYTVRVLNDGTILYEIDVAPTVLAQDLRSTEYTGYREGFSFVFNDTNIISKNLVRGTARLPIRTPEAYTEALLGVYRQTTQNMANIKKRREEDPETAAAADTTAKQLLIRKLQQEQPYRQAQAA